MGSATRDRPWAGRHASKPWCRRRGPGVCRRDSTQHRVKRSGAGGDPADVVTGSPRQLRRNAVRGRQPRRRNGPCFRFASTHGCHSAWQPAVNRSTSPHAMSTASTVSLIGAASIAHHHDDGAHTTAPHRITRPFSPYDQRTGGSRQALTAARLAAGFSANISWPASGMTTRSALGNNAICLACHPTPITVWHSLARNSTLFVNRSTPATRLMVNLPSASTACANKLSAPRAPISRTRPLPDHRLHSDTPPADGRCPGTCSSGTQNSHPLPAHRDP